ncbi:Transposase, Mutator family [Paenibacillus sp. CF384]|nr:Transposase, Mutator family [Paenibacillus sp. CF384]
MNIIPENTLSNLFENLVTQFVKDNLESLMKAEIKHFMANTDEEHNSRNGYYKRSLHTKYGAIEELEVPRDRLKYLSRISGGMDGLRKP